MKYKLIGIDLAKNVFQVCAINQAGKDVFNRSVTRAKLAATMAVFEPTTVALEACASGHYWGRKFEQMGHRVLLVPPQHVQPFVRGGKSDARDALAIVEAAQRPKLHPVPIKTLAQQDLQSLHRVRRQVIDQMTATGNQIRGIAREYGVEFKTGIHALVKQLPEVLEEAENDLTPMVRQLIAEQLEQLRHYRQRNDALHARIVELASQDPAYGRLLELPGVGPVVASAYLASIGNGHQFHKGREVSAWLGLVPRQSGTGGKIKLLGMTKNGDRYLRTMLIHGARAAITWSRNKQTPLAQWVNPMVVRRGMNKTVVALANKTARIGWLIVARGEHYDVNKAFGSINPAG